ncbi:MAG: hypothetical protein A2Z14_09130 [Chloroflexi bacterium RBG_16_48_8]|nr:MAG: hypothetical protein A2Z14_09130 [Chloroflexi bacterium RBG_16_48_8]
MANKTVVLSGTISGARLVASREIRDQLRDWRILSPILVMTLFFPLLMNFTAEQAMGFVGRYGASIVGDRLIPFLLMVVGFFPISISLVIALESFAGERERLSLEPLLATPLTDGQLYLGKMLASVLLPLLAAFSGIFVYLGGLYLRLGWIPPGQLLLQVLLLTFAQAVVMVSGAVVISSQATSVRAANLLASFVIMPVSQLIIAESLIMFWGRYDVLWLILLALFLISIVLGRMGLHLFHRETLLGREIDVLNLQWTFRHFKREFIRGSANVIDWYRDLFRYSLRSLRSPVIITLIVFIAAYVLGDLTAARFRIPSEAFQFDRLNETLESEFAQLGWMSSKGWTWILSTNIRALGLATLFGIFSFGIMGEILLMLPIAIIGYFAGNLGLAGQNAAHFLIALVLPHAILEIPAAILIGGAILQLGMTIMSPPKGSTLGESWITALAEWARISVGLVLPLMVGAAILETYVTPRIALMMLSG